MPSDDSLQTVPGGVTAAAGFLAGTASCGIKDPDNKRPDLALVCSESPSVAAAVFTTNRVKAAPVHVSTAHLRTRDVRAVVLNSGCPLSALRTASPRPPARSVLPTARPPPAPS